MKIPAMITAINDAHTNAVSHILAHVLVMCFKKRSLGVGADFKLKSMHSSM